MNQQARVLKQMIAMQKASFDGMISALISMWEQTGGFTEGAVWVPEEGRKAFKSIIDSGYSNLEQFFGTAAQGEKQQST
jgi:hypothetical protein